MTLRDERNRASGYEGQGPQEERDAEDEVDLKLERGTGGASGVAGVTLLVWVGEVVVIKVLADGRWAND